jgi:serine/threonine protein kinase
MAEQNRLGKYELQEKLGEGTYAEVYRAVNTAVGRTVALKVLRSEMMTPEAFTRFRKEAQAAASLEHPQIVDVVDMDEANGCYFLVMRYVDGPSLAEVLEQRGGLPWDEALGIVKRICEALDYAHQKGLVHRDVKPSNILISEKEGAVLTDFGLVKGIEASSKVTRSGMIPGTPQYTPPEIWDGKEASPVSDQYALACVVYEILTGETLFDGPTPYAVMKRHSASPAFPKIWPEGVSEHVEAVLTRALEKEPSERYESCWEFSAALTEAGRLKKDFRVTADKTKSNLEGQVWVERVRNFELAGYLEGFLNSYRQVLWIFTKGDNQESKIRVDIVKLEQEEETPPAQETQVISAQKINQTQSKPAEPERSQETTATIAQAYTHRMVGLMIIFILLIPLLTGMQQMRLPTSVQVGVQDFYDLAAYNLQHVGAPVLLAVEYEPAFAGEMGISASGVVEQLLRQQARITLISTSPTGPALGEDLLRTVNNRIGLHYDLDQMMVDLGYLPGGSASLQAFALDPARLTPYDLRSTLVWGTPGHFALNGITNLSDYFLVIVLTDNPDTARGWIEQVESLLNETPFLMITSAQTAPMVAPYSDSGQLDGLVSGLSGGVSYELLMGQSGQAQRYWDAYQIGLIMAVTLTLAGALYYTILAPYRVRGRRRRKG